MQEQEAGYRDGHAAHGGLRSADAGGATACLFERTRRDLVRSRYTVAPGFSENLAIMTSSILHQLKTLVAPAALRSCTCPASGVEKWRPAVNPKSSASLAYWRQTRSLPSSTIFSFPYQYHS